MSRDDAPNLRQAECCYSCINSDDRGTDLWCDKYRFFPNSFETCNNYEGVE